MKKKKKSRRDSVKFANLRKEYNLRTRVDLLDYDYVGLLSPSEKAYLDEFTQGFVSASFREGSDMFNSAQKRKAYSSNNHRNVDTYTLLKSIGMLSFCPDCSVSDRYFIDDNTPETIYENGQTALALKKEILSAFTWDAATWTKN